MFFLLYLFCVFSCTWFRFTFDFTSLNIVIILFQWKASSKTTKDTVIRLSVWQMRHSLMCFKKIMKMFTYDLIFFFYSTKSWKMKLSLGSDCLLVRQVKRRPKVILMNAFKCFCGTFTLACLCNYRNKNRFSLNITKNLTNWLMKTKSCSLDKISRLSV